MQAIMATEETESLDPTMLIPVSILLKTCDYYTRLRYRLRSVDSTHLHATVNLSLFAINWPYDRIMQ